MAEKLPQLDSRIEVVTPENIAFQYRVAGPFRRLPAYVIDICLQILILLVSGMLINFLFAAVRLQGLGVGLMLVIYFLVAWFYGGVFETLWNGQTPGKRMMRIRVVTTTGQPINALQAVLRNVLRFVDSAPVIPIPDVGVLPVIPLYQVGLIACLSNDRYQRLGDLACGTMVVIEEGRWMAGITRITEPQVISLAESLPATFQPTRSLGRWLAHYVDRRSRFTPARRAEIAQRLGEPLREKLGLPRDTSHDLLLCAVYYRAFVVERPTERPSTFSPKTSTETLDLEELLRT